MAVRPMTVQERLEQLKEMARTGNVLQGTVKKVLARGGRLVDLGSRVWGLLDRPRDNSKEGDRLEVVVQEVQMDSGRVFLTNPRAD